MSADGDCFSVPVLIVPVAWLHHIRKRPVDTFSLLSLCLKHELIPMVPNLSVEEGDVLPPE